MSPHFRDEERFRDLYSAHGRAVLAFALRRTARPEDAADVLAETFLVAWRRLGDVPTSEPRLWLFGVARNVLANQRRGEVRRSQLTEKIGATLAHEIRELPNDVETSAALEKAWRGLSSQDRELLALWAWEGLTPSAIAQVLSAPQATVRTRLHRARRRLRGAMDGSGDNQPPAASRVKVESVAAYDQGAPS